MTELMGEEALVACRAVIHESQVEVEEAEQLLNTMDEELVYQVKIKQLLNVVLENERNQIEKLVNDGSLTEKEAHHILENVDHDLHVSHKKAKMNRVDTVSARRSRVKSNMDMTAELSESLTTDSTGSSVYLRGEASRNLATSRALSAAWKSQELQKSFSDGV